MVGPVQALVRTGRLAEAAEGLRRYESLLDALPGGPWPARLGLAGACWPKAHGNRWPPRPPTPPIWPISSSRTPRSPGPSCCCPPAGWNEQGHRREAIDQLRAAREIFLQLRAAPYIERCDQEFSAAGLRPLKQDPLALTSREQDVATLVARGLTNNETAAQLFLTPKTIE